MERIRLYDEVLDLVIEWNGSNTFNVFNFGSDGTLINVDCFTVYGENLVLSRDEAITIILERFEELKSA